MSKKSGKKAVPKKTKEVQASAPSTEERWNPLSKASASEPVVAPAKKANVKVKAGLASLLIAGIGLIGVGSLNWGKLTGPSAPQVAAHSEAAIPTEAKPLQETKAAPLAPAMTKSAKVAGTTAEGKANLQSGTASKSTQAINSKTAKTEKAAVKGKTKAKQELAAKASPGKKAKDTDKKKIAKKDTKQKKLEAKVKNKKTSTKTDKKTLAVKTRD